MRSKIFLLGILYMLMFSGYSQNGPSTWIELDLSKRIAKDLKLELNPELRLLGDFKMDSYIFEGGLSYKVHKYFSIAGYYRYEDEYDYKKSTGQYKSQQSLNRLAFDGKTGFKLKGFDLQFRLRYTKGLDPVETTADKTSYFRYRAKVDYQMLEGKIIPNVSVEVFHDMILNDLDKIRYTFGLAYPINKKNEIGLFYRLQDYFEPSDFIGDKKESSHIIGLGYSLKF